MTTGQTFLTIGALVLLSVTLMGFYRLLAHNGERLDMSQAGITSATIATSFMEIASGLAFDAATDTTNEAIWDINWLTEPSMLGHEDTQDDSLQKFDDFDDFNRFKFVRDMPGMLGEFTTVFNVSYVDPTNVAKSVTNRTYVKRLDMKIWRSYPPPPSGEPADTLRMSMIMGYFNFE